MWKLEREKMGKGTGGSSHRVLYGVIIVLFLFTCYFFAVDLYAQRAGDTPKFPHVLEDEEDEGVVYDEERDAAERPLGEYGDDGGEDDEHDDVVGKLGQKVHDVRERMRNLGGGVKRSARRREFEKSSEWLPNGDLSHDERMYLTEIRRHDVRHLIVGPYGISEEARDKFEQSPLRLRVETVSEECKKTKSYDLVEFARKNVRRFIDSFALTSDLEAFHPHENYLLDAKEALDNAIYGCPWQDCLGMCVNASIGRSLLALREQDTDRSAAVLEQASIHAQGGRRKGRLLIYQGLTQEVAGYVPVAVSLYQRGVETWPDLNNHYMGIVRFNVPGNAQDEEKMKLYFYGKEEEVLPALLDGLLAKEFYPENLESYPLLHTDEPKEFYQGGTKEYKLIKQLQSPFIQQANAKMMDKLITNGRLPFKDPQAKRHYAYNERFSRFFQFATVSVIRAILGRPVFISYTYFGGYVGGSALSPHTDRPACEYTMSLCIDHYPRGSTWPLGINHESLQGLKPTSPGGPGEIPPDDKIVWAKLQPGDSFIFKGREKVHWRDGELPEGHYSRVYFFHYTHSDFKGLLT